MNTHNKQEPTQAEQNGILYQIRQKYGVVGDTDSYKLSHMPQYVKGATKMISYFEARGGEHDRIMNYGAQMITKEYMIQRLTQSQADAMIEWANEHMNGNMVDNLKIALDVVINEHGGRMPIRIRNAKEGLMIPIHNVLLTIESTVEDERIFALVSYFETKLVRAWSPMTVATTSYYVRQEILSQLEETADDPQAEINFKFHDFGSRGTPAMEASAFAGSGHLVSSMGTDTVVAVHAIEFAYGTRMAGYSIPASEHSSTTSHGRDGELDLITQMFDAYAKPGAIFATVADSYDIMNFIRNYTPLFKERLIASGATWVIRPDSGDPIDTPVQCMVELEKVFGVTVNSKGYKVLNHVRVIQGDGIEPKQVKEIYDAAKAKGYSASNLAIGMGGGLLQKNNRDTHKFALKMSAVKVNGHWQDVYKDPSVYDSDWNKLDVDSFKKSKAGQLELMHNVLTGEYKTVTIEEAMDMDQWDFALETVYEDGYMVRDVTFDEVRKNAGMF